MIQKTTLIAAAKALFAALLIRFAGIFDRGLDSVLGQFTKLDAKLDKHIAKKKATLSSLAAAREASRNREEAVSLREADFRLATFKKADAVIGEKTRAERVRKRLSTLLD